MSPSSILTRWNAQVRQRPDDCAVSAPDRTWTHRQLADHVAALGDRLPAGDTTRADAPILLICADPVQVIAGLLACAAAGRTFAPLDVRQPPARLRAAVERLRPAAALADAAGLAALAGAEAADGIALVDTAAVAPRRWTEDDAKDETPDRGYVYFTSGTTGVPKGISGSLEGVAHFVDWEIEEFGLTHGVRVSLLTSPGFDAFLRDALVPLCAGGTVCVAPPGSARIGTELARWLAEQRVGVLHCVPTVLRTLRPALTGPADLPDLTTVLLAGEPVHASDVAWWRGLFGDDKKLVNLYGPSETTMTKVFHRLTSDDATAEIVPAGRPMPGVAVRVLSGGAEVVDAIGEVEIQVPFALRGYLGGERGGFRDTHRYRTGDLGRLRADGTLELLGRRDQQVKVNGVRVELGETEEAMRRHPAISDVCVTAVQQHADTLLCAYVVAAPDATDDDLRAHAAARLTPEARPALLVRVADLPRTLSGKVDRRALPAPVTTGSATGDAPRGATETAVAAIWCELLYLPAVSREDDFLLLGGTSLAVARLLDALRTRFGAEVPLRAFLTEPTLAALAAVVDRHLTASAATTGERAKEKAV